MRVAKRSPLEKTFSRNLSLDSKKRVSTPSVEEADINLIFFCRFAFGSAPACGSKEESVQHRLRPD